MLSQIQQHPVPVPAGNRRSALTPPLLPLENLGVFSLTFYELFCSFTKKPTQVSERTPKADASCSNPAGSDKGTTGLTGH